LRYAEPILDGDLFFHFAYARQMLTTGSLRLDHTIYSWTPTDGGAVYCAWISEILLYGIWSVTGLTGIFVLRYLVVLSVLGLILLFAWRRRLAWSAVTALVLVASSILLYAGSLPKPDMFTPLLFTATVYVYATERTRAAESPKAGLGFFGAPLLMLVWANAHGGFILAAPFFGATGIGEIILFMAKTPARLSARSLYRFLAAWALTILATMLTPYGARWVLYLLHDLLVGNTARTDFAWNNAYISTLGLWPFQLWLAGILAGLFLLSVHLWRRDRIALLGQGPLILATAAYIPLYLAYVRATPFLPLAAAFLALSLAGALRAADGRPAGEAKLQTATSVAAVLAAGALALNGAAHAVLYPDPSGWTGFGIGTLNPVTEAAFLARQTALGSRLYNDYDSGSYLLWRLYPRYRVMTDSRSFPYLSWFPDQEAFTKGVAFDDFIRRYPGDVAVADLNAHGQWHNFVSSAGWRLAFYGPTAAVFVKAAEVPGLQVSTADADPNRFCGLRSMGAAAEVFEFATYIGDYKAAAVALQAQLQSVFPPPDTLRLAREIAYRDGVLAIRRHDYDAALAFWSQGLDGRQDSDRDLTIMILLQSLARAPETMNGTTRTHVLAALNHLLPDGF
jgi:hypothetical protein